MILSSLPANYSSASENCLFTFSQVDPAQSVGIEIRNASTMAVLGRKRFKGSTTFALDVAAYARRQLSPLPSRSAQTSFFNDSRRTSRLKLSWGDGEVSEERTFTPSLADLVRGQLLRTDTLPTEIPLGGRDEISVVTAAGDTLAATILLDDPFSTQRIVTKQNCPTGITSLAVVASDIVAYSLEQSEVKGFTVTLALNGDLVGEVVYRLVPDCSERLTVEWLNRKGGFECHPFEIRSRRRVVLSREVVKKSESSAAVMTTGAVETLIGSGMQPRERLQTLSDIALSSIVRLIEGGATQSVTVVDSTPQLIERDGKAEVVLTVRTVRETTSKIF
ncbi:MAG: hypothetical protein SOZ00_03160 [Tidjanibacter sp.]|nr:hypothetical protein [Tidjanibacter sp.]